MGTKISPAFYFSRVAASSDPECEQAIVISNMMSLCMYDSESDSESTETASRQQKDIAATDTSSQTSQHAIQEKSAKPSASMNEAPQDTADTHAELKHAPPPGRGSDGLDSQKLDGLEVSTRSLETSSQIPSTITESAPAEPIASVAISVASDTTSQSHSTSKEHKKGKEDKKERKEKSAKKEKKPDPFSLLPSADALLSGASLQSTKAAGHGTASHVSISPFPAHSPSHTSSLPVKTQSQPQSQNQQASSVLQIRRPAQTAASATPSKPPSSLLFGDLAPPQLIQGRANVNTEDWTNMGFSRAKLGTKRAHPGAAADSASSDEGSRVAGGENTTDAASSISGSEPGSGRTQEQNGPTRVKLDHPVADE